MSMRRILGLVLIAGLSAGGAWSARAASTVTAEEVLRADRLGATGDPTTSIASSEVLALSDEMREFLDRNVNPGATAKFKMQQLVDALMGTKDFRLEYDEDTRTASETFRLRRGNCLSFTVLFVALARGVDLQAEFQEVEIPPDWSTREDVFVLNLHINVRVDLRDGGIRAVDFNIGDFKSTYEVEVIPDRRAIAHFFNNMGVERMQTGKVEEAVAFFRRAILETDGDFGPAWNNLGTLYRKAGLFEYAEAAYFEALEVDRRDAVAMSNLERIYREVGDPEKAEVYREKVDSHRMRNPHLRYALARKAFENRDFDAAIDHLKFAARHAPDRGDYSFLLGVCYLVSGDPAKARRWVERAERAAETDEERQDYAARFEALRRQLASPD